MAGITQKAVWLYFHCGPSKKFFLFLFILGGEIEQMGINRSTQKTQSLNLIRSHVSIMTTVTIIIVSLITNIKIVTVIIVITKNDCHNNNSNNNNNNNNDNNTGTNNSNNI